nr:TOBE domain-containing protein [uncultured Sulfurimonas sp.]
MNEFKATITNIQNVENLNIVKFDFNGIKLSMMSLELSDKITINSKVILSTKPTHIALAKNFSGDISHSNQLDAKIVEINSAELLCSVKLSIADAMFESIITKNSALRMNLQVGEKVTLFIKASELSIKEILKC